MTEKRFKRVYSMRNGQIGITDELHDSGDKSFPKNLTVNETVELLNMLHEENTEFRTALKELREIGDYQAHRINKNAINDRE